MTRVEFIKDHPSGLKAGHKATVQDKSAERWISQGYAQEIEAEEPAEAGKTDTPPPPPPPAQPVVKSSTSKKAK